jgi:hypothetical protein
MRRKYILFYLPLLLAWHGEAHASPTCAATVGELGVMLGHPIFPLKWE